MANTWSCASVVIPRVAPNNGVGKVLSGYFNAWLRDMKACFVDIGMATAANDVNPFSPGIGSASDLTSSMSQTSLAGAASYSVQKGLTVPLRSSIVRAGMSNAELLGKVSGVTTMISIDGALIHGLWNEVTQCN